MSNSEIEQSGTVKGHLPNEASLSGRISNGLSLSGHISIGSGAGDFIIKMTIEVNGDNYTVTSCDKTMEQIDAAVASGQNIKAIALDKYVMPMTQMEYSESYTFEAFLASFLVAANVAKNPESGTDDWQFYLSPITADIVEYSNAAMPRISTVSEALDKLVPNSHTHANKAVLDKFTETDGKPAYDGEALGRDFVIKMTVEFKGSELIVTSCDTTVEQIDEAVVAEKRVVLVASVGGTILELPMVQGDKGYSYYFCSILSESVFLSSVYKIENTSDWSFGMIPISRDITAEDVGYPNSFGEGAPENVGQALDVLITGFNATRKDILRLNKSEHTHSNKLVLDKFTETDGKPTYDGKKISGASTAEEVEYTNAILPDASNVKSALDDTIDTQQTQSADLESLRAGVSALMDAYETQGGDIASLKTQAHTHSNKAVLDKFAESDGKLQYNGSDVGLKGDKGDTPVKGTDYWTESDKAEIVADTLAALPTWTGGNY